MPEGLGTPPPHTHTPNALPLVSVFLPPPRSSAGTPSVQVPQLNPPPLTHVIAQVLEGLPEPLIKLCDFGYSKSEDMSVPKSRVGTLACERRPSQPSSSCPRG